MIDCTMLLDRKPLMQQNDTQLELTGSYLVWADFGIGHSQFSVSNVCRNKRSYNLYYLAVDEFKSPVRKVDSQVNAKWIFDALRSRDPDGVKFVAQTVDGVNSLIAKREFRFLDRVFEIVPPSTASRHVLLSLLRASAPVRSKLPYWQQYVLKVRDAFDARGLNSARLLRGLLD